jgi:class 3 adenylate cyclase
VPLPPPAHDPERVAEFLGPRSDLSGERKHVSVLFADVTASMAVLTSHDAEEAAALFDQVVEYMVEAVRRWEGTVTQVLGDGIMALFGAPVAQEDHAIRACYAALRMQQRITAYGDDVQRAHGIPILIRVGLNSGEVVLRPLGSDPSALSAVGQTVHLASRLEQLAKPGTVLASSLHRRHDGPPRSNAGDRPRQRQGPCPARRGVRGGRRRQLDAARGVGSPRPSTPRRA